MLSFLLLVLSLLFLPLSVFATYDPLSVPNNKYGIHVTDTNDVTDTSTLVNSSGGDWGYVTMVMTDGDKDLGKWQGIMNSMRRLHLIPILRLATHLEGDAWAKPSKESAVDWARFLNKLNWPVSNRYVVIFNEPNHAKEWGNTLNPEEYADILETFSKLFREHSSDFYVLSAGLDASAASDAEAMDEAIFLQRMVSAQPDVLSAIDGWTSHSYPNPGFSGSPYATGRGTLRTYQWEQWYLGQLGFSRQLPVFITETGWMHSQGKVINSKLLSPESVAQNIRGASAIWQDPVIVAVTPFVFNYQDFPFDHFSWKMLGSGDYYPQFFSYQTIAKIKGEPQQNLVYKLQTPLFPSALVANSTYTLETEVKNDGQGILDSSDDYSLSVSSIPLGFESIFDVLPILEPGETGTIRLHIKTFNPGTYSVQTVLNHYGKQIPLEKKELTLVPPPAIQANLTLGWRRTSEASDVTILVYDGNRLVHKFTGLRLENGHVNVLGLTGIIPGNSYRVVVIVPYYLPRQTIQILDKDVTTISFKRLLPFDIDGDGALTLKDFVAAVKLPPKVFFGRLVGP